MKRVSWKKTGVEHRKEWNEEKEEDEVVAHTEIHFKDGTVVRFKAKKVDQYSGRNDETHEIIFKPSIQGNSRGEEIVVEPIEAGKCRLKIATIQFSKVVIITDFIDMMKIVNAIDYVLKTDEKNFLIEPFDIPEED